MRSIDADALMDVINRNSYPVQHDITSIEPGMTCMGILQAVQEQPTIEPESRWIPCEERLPEGNLYVLVTYKYQYGLMDLGITWYSERENKWCDVRPIIAWMPLPEPYGGEHDGDK